MSRKGTPIESKPVKLAPVQFRDIDTSYSPSPAPNCAKCDSNPKIGTYFTKPILRKVHKEITACAKTFRNRSFEPTVRPIPLKGSLTMRGGISSPTYQVKRAQDLNNYEIYLENCRAKRSNKMDSNVKNIFNVQKYFISTCNIFTARNSRIFHTCL